jgi:hypothetical protein
MRKTRILVLAALSAVLSVVALAIAMAGPTPPVVIAQTCTPLPGEPCATWVPPTQSSTPSPSPTVNPDPVVQADTPAPASPTSAPASPATSGPLVQTATPDSPKAYSSALKDITNTVYHLGKVLAGTHFKHGRNMSVYASTKYNIHAPTQILANCNGASWRHLPVPDFAAFRVGRKQVEVMPCRPISGQTNKNGTQKYKPDLDVRDQTIDTNIRLLSPLQRSFFRRNTVKTVYTACRALKSAQRHGVRRGHRMAVSCTHLRAVDAGRGRITVYGTHHSHWKYFLWVNDGIAGGLMKVIPWHGKWHVRRLDNRPRKQRAAKAVV